MSTKPSDQMMELLQELAQLKKLKEEQDRDGSAADAAGLESTENRLREITEQIKALGEAQPNRSP